MYHLSLAECQRRRILLGEIRKEMEAGKYPSARCDCYQSAKASQPELIRRLNAGDALASESILAFYQGCINDWAKDIYDDPVYESHFKAEIAAMFIQKCSILDSDSLCHQLKAFSTEIADSHLKHIEEYQQEQLACQDSVVSV